MIYFDRIVIIINLIYNHFKLNFKYFSISTLNLAIIQSALINIIKLQNFGLKVEYRFFKY